MYPSVVYGNTSSGAGVGQRVTRRLWICFHLLILTIAFGALQQAKAGGGDLTRLSNAGEWNDTKVLTTLNGLLYTIERNGALYRTDLATGRWVQLGKAEFANTQFMFGDSRNLYPIETDGNLYRVSAVNGAWNRVGQAGNWKDTIGAVTLNNNLYTRSDSSIDEQPAKESVGKIGSKISLKKSWPAFAL